MTCVVCVVRTIGFIVRARSVVGFVVIGFIPWMSSVVGVVRMVCFISWRRASMIGVIRTIVCMVLSSDVGIVVVASFSRPASCSSLSQVSNDKF